MIWRRIKDLHSEDTPSGFRIPVSECPHGREFWAQRKPNKWTTEGFSVCGDCGKKWPR